MDDVICWCTGLPEFWAKPALVQLLNDSKLQPSWRWHPSLSCDTVRAVLFTVSVGGFLPLWYTIPHYDIVIGFSLTLQNRIVTAAYLWLKIGVWEWKELKWIALGSLKWHWLICYQFSSPEKHLVTRRSGFQKKLKFGCEAFGIVSYHWNGQHRFCFFFPCLTMAAQKGSVRSSDCRVVRFP